jgi:ribosome-associated protein
MTEDGIIIIDARRFRTQERNRNDARERLVELIRRAAIPPRIRRPTRPTAGARRARLEDKKLRSRTKILRRTTTDDKS